MKNRALLLMLTLVLCFTSLPVSAASVDVTAKMKSNKNVKKLVHDINYPINYMLDGQLKSTKTVSMKSMNLLSMAAYVGYHARGKVEFSRADIHKITKDLFGKKPSTKGIQSWNKNKKWHIAKNPGSGKAYVYAGGDFGDCTPTYKITAVYKVKKNVYDVYVDNNLKTMVDVDANSMPVYETQKLGSSVIRIKKYKKSKYNYIIKKITMTPNPNAWN